MVKIPELQSYSREHLLILQKVLQELLPVRDLAMFEHQFQGDVLKKQIFGRAENGGEVLLF